MRCTSCNTNLNDIELARVDPVSGVHMDLCGECLQASERALAEDRYHREAVVDFVTQEPPQDPEAFYLCAGQQVRVQVGRGAWAHVTNR
jgi:hypothetical protein